MASCGAELGKGWQGIKGLEWIGRQMLVGCGGWLGGYGKELAGDKGRLCG